MMAFNEIALTLGLAGSAALAQIMVSVGTADKHATICNILGYGGNAGQQAYIDERCPCSRDLSESVQAMLHVKFFWKFSMYQTNKLVIEIWEYQDSHMKVATRM